MKEERRKNINKIKIKPNLFDLAILLLSLILCSVLFTIVNINSCKANNENGDRIAHVFYNNEEIKRINLSSLEEDYELILLEEDYPLVKQKMVINFSKEKGVAVIESHCKDLICLHEGYINDSSKAIICLPGSIVITITSTSNMNEGWM